MDGGDSKCEIAESKCWRAREPLCLGMPRLTAGQGQPTNRTGHSLILVFAARVWPVVDHACLMLLRIGTEKLLT